MAAALLIPHRELTGIERPVPFWLEEGMHVVIFLVLFLLVHRALAAVPAVPRPVRTTLGLTLLYGLLLETAQLWVPGRGFQVLDLWMNLAGVVFGSLLVGWRRPRSRL